MPRFFDPQDFVQDQPATLGDNAAHHAVNVLRMATGDVVTLFNGSGGEWQARLVEVGHKQVTVLPLAFNPVNRTPPARAHLWLPLIKGERLDWALQKATELGATSIRLYTSERTEVRLKDERLDKKLEQWRSIAINACEQCGLNVLPEILPPLPLAQLWACAGDDLKLIAHPGRAPLDFAHHRHSDFILLTGPEGGFSPAELEQAQRAGFTAFSLGERILRAETAPVALLAAIWALHSA